MTFRAPKGVSEYLPPRGALFDEAREAFAESARRACYGHVETAVLEDTALSARALPVKVFTSGPAFRCERPRAGRHRQFCQFDLEAIGTEDPAVDAETIAVAWDACASLGLTRHTLLLNSLGDRQCRPLYREALRKFLRGLDLGAGELIGAEERSKGTVRLKDLKTGDQQDVTATAATDSLLGRLGTL